MRPDACYGLIFRNNRQAQTETGNLLIRFIQLIPIENVHIICHRGIFMVSYVHISDEILEWLNGQSGSFPKDVCEKLEAWRSGKKKPTFSQVEEMSKKPKFRSAISF